MRVYSREVGWEVRGVGRCLPTGQTRLLGPREGVTCFGSVCSTALGTFHALSDPQVPLDSLVPAWSSFRK